jgi:hypothetical protein
MEVCGIHGAAPPRGWKENAMILSKLGKLGKGAFKASGAWKENALFLSKIGKLGKRAFKAPKAWKENGLFLSKRGGAPARSPCRSSCR